MDRPIFAQSRRSARSLEIWGNSWDPAGRTSDRSVVFDEITVVKRFWSTGQADGSLGEFDTRGDGREIKAALDALLNQLAADLELDLEAYGAELVSLFERAIRKGRT